MRLTIVLVVLGTFLFAAAAHLGSARQPADDALARSITRLVETAR